MRRLRFCISVILLTVVFIQYSDSQELKEGYNILSYPNGKKASEGMVKNGRPDGFWVSYYVSGTKRSEGNRKNFLLDSIWIFYNQLGDTTEKISYVLGKKNGYSMRYGYRRERIGKDKMILLSKELYVNDNKEGWSYYYNDKSGKLEEMIKYKNGKRDGISFFFSPDSTIREVRDYKNDFIIQIDRLNRRDTVNLKQGLWRDYYPDGKIKNESIYKNGKLDGIYKEFNDKGSLTLSLLYRDGKIIDDKLGLNKQAEVHNKYDENNNLIFSGSYIDDTIPVGIHRYYDKNGEVINAMVYGTNGVLISKGIIDNEGKRIGNTIFYFPDGRIKAEGNYSDNKKTGKWKFIEEDGKIEQEGNFKNDLPDGHWVWYYPDGRIIREEEYLNGKEDGLYVEYDENGNIITKGDYVEGEQEGDWTYNVGDHSEIGKYVSGLRDGMWKYYYQNGKIQFEGTYIQGNLDGKVKLYYDTGQIMEEQYYSNGIKEKNWKKYDKEGKVLLTVTYVDDNETKINGAKIDHTEREVKLIK